MGNSCVNYGLADVLVTSGATDDSRTLRTCASTFSDRRFSETTEGILFENARIVEEELKEEIKELEARVNELTWDLFRKGNSPAVREIMLVQYRHVIATQREKEEMLKETRKQILESLKERSEDMKDFCVTEIETESLENYSISAEEEPDCFQV